MAVIRFKEVLTLVVGTTPQIITETIYGLIQQKPPIRPEKIYVITSAVGKKTAEERLLDSGVFQAFTREFKLDELTLTTDDFIVAKNSVGDELDDIANKQDSEAMGDLISSLVRDLTADRSVRLHCSIAGGRKTMSFYMGAALQLFGRPWDRLYHVLVTPEFESNPLFFYKPKRDTIIETRLPDGSIKKLNTRDAHIHLMELPFIRFRDKLSLQGKTFRDLVKEGQREIDTAAIQLEVKVNLKNRTLRIGSRIIEMVPVQLMVYTALLRQKTDRCIHPDSVYCGTCTDCFEPITTLLSKESVDRMIEDYRLMYHHTPDRADELKSKWHGRTGSEAFRQTLSKISRSIKEQFPDQRLHAHYTVATERIYGGSRYGVRTEKGKVTIE